MITERKSHVLLLQDLVTPLDTLDFIQDKPMHSLKLLDLIVALLNKSLHIRNVVFQLHDPFVRISLTKAMDYQGFSELFATFQEHLFHG